MKRFTKQLGRLRVPAFAGMTSWSAPSSFAGLTAWLLAGLMLLPLLAALVSPLTARALTQGQLRDLGSGPEGLDRAKELFGDNVPQSRYRILPEPFSPDKEASQYGIVICAKEEPNCPAESEVKFMLGRAEHSQRDNGKDTFNYIFLPTINGRPVATSPLKFIYKIHEDGRHDMGLVWGQTNLGAKIEENEVARLEGFNNTPLVEEVLQSKDNKEGLEWADQGGVVVTTNKTGFFERSKVDPFGEAIRKLAEGVASLTTSVIGALEWAMKVDLSDVKGLPDAWKVIRDLVNLLFVLILTALAIMTIIRIEPQKYNIRSTLPLLIFSVIAVNFSFLFAQIMINTASVLSQPFLDGAHALITGGGNMQTGLAAGQGAGFGEAIVLLVASLILLLALLVLLVFFIIRIIVVWLIAALSPVVFLFLVLPLTRGESKKIVQSWVRWVYMAPVAFLIMFIGAQVAFRPDLSTGDQGAEAILNALFYGGVVLAAAFIPIALGGSIMNMALRHGRTAGRVSGKGGLGIANVIPVGGGHTAGSALRAGRAFVKQRTDAQEDRAQEQAATLGGALHERLGQGNLATVVTGRDMTQAASVTEAQVDNTMKRMESIGFQDADARQVIAYSMASDAEKARLRPSMTSEQLAYADSHIGRLSSAKTLARSGWWDWDIARAYGHTGYQNLVSGDPIMQNLKRQKYAKGHQFSERDFNSLDLGIVASSMDGDDMRKLYPGFWEYNDANSGNSQSNMAAHRVFRQLISDEGLAGKRLNSTAMRQNVDTNHRNVAAPHKRALQLKTYANAGLQTKMDLLSGNLSAREYVPIPGGPRTRDDAQRELTRLRSQLGVQKSGDNNPGEDIRADRDRRRHGGMSP